MKKPIIIIAGATACGKTGASISLAKNMDGEIISADSMQVYKYMNIGTAKITKKETDGVPHHLIDEIYPDDEFSVAIFKEKANKYIEQIHSRGKCPIIVGGTGFYINSIIYDNNFTKMENDINYRRELENVAQKNGVQYLHDMLTNVDYESSQNIHPNNIKKVIRAIEYHKITGEKISVHNEREKQKEKVYNSTFCILNMDRDKLYNRINIRVDKMINDGLLKEVRTLLQKGYKKELVSMQGIGYKEIVKHINGEYSIEQAIDLIKQNTRHFAKRQITWFKNQVDNGLWIDTENLSNDEIATYIKNKIKGD